MKYRRVTNSEKEAFIQGVKKLMSVDENWMFLFPLICSLDNCAMCQACVERCPMFLANGRNIEYSPVFRTELLRRLIKNYARKNRGALLLPFRNQRILDNVITHLYVLSYSCTLCRRCAQACPMGLDSSIITRELRKLFSQELEWAPEELHERGTKLHLIRGSPTGMSSEVFVNEVEFLLKDFSETLGVSLACQWDVSEADILFIPSAGEIFSEPENFIAMLVLLSMHERKWTISSNPFLYDGVNYGVFYSDIEMLKILNKQIEAIKKLAPKEIVLSECGHQHKVFKSIAQDMGLLGTIKVWDTPSFIRRVVLENASNFDPQRNDFPVTLHDPCNLVRGLGIVAPQREVLTFLCPHFREMEPSGYDNYCCGGGGGLVLISDREISNVRLGIGGKLKAAQIHAVFEHESKAPLKYVCAPCLNCRMQIREIVMEHVPAGDVIVGGLARLTVNALKELKASLIEYDS